MSLMIFELVFLTFLKNRLNFSFKRKTKKKKKFSLHFPKVCETGFDRSFRELNATCIEFPGLPAIRGSHFPQSVLDSHDPAFVDTLRFCEQLTTYDGIIINTFDSLEPDAVKAIADRGETIPPVYYIGPILANQDKESPGYDPCLSWLDRQPKQSVVLLCFGSGGRFSKSQLDEIAVGLEKTGERFLWVLKNPNRNDAVDFDLEDVLPAGFLERTENRGLVVKSWAPQLEVLRHEAVGGFVTHCGWNSILEAVTSGVPMLAWPLYAEQHVLRTVLVEGRKMAIGIDEDENGFVTAEEVKKKVEELMDSEKGRLLRERSLKMKEMSAGAMADSGSSTASLTKLLQILNY